jgi:antitoxin (DNA-binding transcriptional repressor) of toxin-antitoxin stability system
MKRYAMKRYTVSKARERMADLLDAAEAGEHVAIERRGVEYTIQAKPRQAATRTRRRLIARVDPAVLDGEWTWTSAPHGLKFARRGRR